MERFRSGELDRPKPALHEVGQNKLFRLDGHLSRQGIRLYIRGKRFLKGSLLDKMREHALDCAVCSSAIADIITVTQSRKKTPSMQQRDEFSRAMEALLQNQFIDTITK